MLPALITVLAAFEVSYSHSGERLFPHLRHHSLAFRRRFSVDDRRYFGALLCGTGFRLFPH